MKKILSLILSLLVIATLTVPFIAALDGKFVTNVPIDKIEQEEDSDAEIMVSDCVFIGHDPQETSEKEDFYTLVSDDICHRDKKTKYKCSRCSYYEYRDDYSSDDSDDENYPLSHVRESYVSVYCDGINQTHVMICKNCGGQYTQYMECPGKYHYSGTCAFLPW